MKKRASLRPLITIFILFALVMPMQECFGMYRSKKTHNLSSGHKGGKESRRDRKNYARFLKEKNRREVGHEERLVKNLYKKIKETRNIDQLFEESHLAAAVFFGVCTSFFQSVKKHILKPGVDVAKEGVRIAIPIIFVEILSKMIPGAEARCHDYVEILCRDFAPVENVFLPEGGLEMRNSYWLNNGHCQHLSNWPLRRSKWTCYEYQKKRGWRFDLYVFKWPRCYHIEVPGRRHGGEGTVFDNATAYMDTLHSFLNKNRNLDFSKHVIEIAKDAATIMEAGCAQVPVAEKLLSAAAVAAGVVILGVGALGGAYCLYVSRKNKRARNNMPKPTYETESQSDETSTSSEFDSGDAYETYSEND